MKRPIVIEFSGLPNSGKTTLLRDLKERFKSNNVNTFIAQENAEFLPKNIPKGTVEQNLWITLQTLQRNLELCFMSDIDYIFSDRGFYDQYFWVKLFKEKDEEYARFMLKFMDEFANKYPVKPDYMYIIDVDVDESIKRRMATGEPVTYSKRDFLIHYKEEFEKFYKTMDNVLYINTTGLEKGEVADIVYNKIITL